MAKVTEEMSAEEEQCVVMVVETVQLGGKVRKDEGHWPGRKAGKDRGGAFPQSP